MVMSLRDALDQSRRQREELSAIGEVHPVEEEVAHVPLAPIYGLLPDNVLFRVEPRGGGPRCSIWLEEVSLLS